MSSLPPLPDSPPSSDDPPIRLDTTSDEEDLDSTSSSDIEIYLTSLPMTELSLSISRPCLCLLRIASESSILTHICAYLLADDQTFSTNSNSKSNSNTQSQSLNLGTSTSTSPPPLPPAPAQHPIPLPSISSPIPSPPPSPPSEPSPSPFPSLDPSSDAASEPYALPDPKPDSSGKTPNVYINGLPPHFPEDQLYALAAPYGPICSVRTFTRHVRDCESGYGFVLYETVQAAERCIASLRKYRNLHPTFSKQAHKIPGTRPVPPLDIHLALPPPSSVSTSTSASVATSDASIPTTHQDQDGLANVVPSISTSTSSTSANDAERTDASAPPPTPSSVSAVSASALGISATAAAAASTDSLSATGNRHVAGAGAGAGASVGAGAAGTGTAMGSTAFKAKMESLADRTSTNLYMEGLPLSIDDAGFGLRVRSETDDGMRRCGVHADPRGARVAPPDILVPVLPDEAEQPSEDYRVCEIAGADAELTYTQVRDARGRGRDHRAPAWEDGAWVERCREPDFGEVRGYGGAEGVEGEFAFAFFFWVSFSELGCRARARARAKLLRLYFAFVCPLVPSTLLFALSSSVLVSNV
ncbi:hypothetical protein H0H92_001659 [Tricholoma furcatifolium]|nr:hypothetical protein H0H92_001659 [Tricholoma furcatifolium]